MLNNPPFNQTIFSAQAATGTGSTIGVADYKNIQLQVGTASSANLTVKIQGSMSETAPDFSAAATVANHWSYLGYWNLDTIASTVGSTGIVASGTDIFQNLLVNVDGLRWLCATVTARSAGSVTVVAFMRPND